MSPMNPDRVTRMSILFYDPTTIYYDTPLSYGRLSGNETIVALYAQGISYRQKFYDRILHKHASHVAFRSNHILKLPLILIW